MYRTVLIILGLSVVRTVSYDDRDFLQYITYSPENALCAEYIIPVILSTNVFEFNANRWENDYDLADYITLSASRKDSGRSPQPLTGPSEFHGNFTISATFCSPKFANWTRSVLLATHGLGFNREYWNSQFAPERYSFVQAVMEAGHAVLFYDRLGVGKSSKLSGWINQASIQTEILLDMAYWVKMGKYTNNLGPPDKLVLLGHSFGSYISAAALAQNPNIADVAVLTGFGYDLDGMLATERFHLRHAKSQNQAKWGYLDGYLTWSDISANINMFFKRGKYFVHTARHIEVTKEPFGVLEYLSVKFLNLNTSSFQGSVLVVNGEYDFLTCGGYCPGFFEQKVRDSFRSARNVETYIQPGTGHALNYHENAADGWWAILAYLERVGIQRPRPYIHY